MTELLFLCPLECGTCCSRWSVSRIDGSFKNQCSHFPAQVTRNIPVSTCSFNLHSRVTRTWSSAKHKKKMSFISLKFGLPYCHSTDRAILKIRFLSVLHWKFQWLFLEKATEMGTELGLVPRTELSHLFALCMEEASLPKGSPSFSQDIASSPHPAPLHK